MYLKGWKQLFIEAMALLFVVSFVVHLAGIWLARLLPVLAGLAVVVLVYRLVLGRWRW